MAQLGVGFISLLGSIPLYLLLKRHFNKTIAFLGFIMFSFSPTLLLSARGILTDNMALSLFMFHIFFIDSALSFNGKKKHIFNMLSALFLVLSILTKFTYAFGAVFLLLFLLFKKEKISTYLELILFSLLFISPYLFWNLAEFGNPVYTFLAGNYVVGQSPGSPFSFYFYNFNYLAELPILIGIVIFFIYLSKKEKRDSLGDSKPLVYSTLIWSILLFLVLSYMSHKEIRYLFPVFSGAIITSCSGYFMFLNSFKNVRTKKSITLKSFFIFFLLFYAISTLIIINTNHYSIVNNYPVDFIEISAWLSAREDDYPIYAMTHYPMLNFYSNKTIFPAVPQRIDAILNCSPSSFELFNINSTYGYFVSFPRGYDEYTRVEPALFETCDIFKEVYRAGEGDVYGVVYFFNLTDSS
ncbi:MAG: hypothetical protein PWR30_160 [Candidatus Woesearchaeota archaeon]|nr:hypothetical protein [Candidatus Woesearchaeota archaeon]